MDITTTYEVFTCLKWLLTLLIRSENIDIATKYEVFTGLKWF